MKVDKPWYTGPCTCGAGPYHKKDCPFLSKGMDGPSGKYLKMEHEEYLIWFKKQEKDLQLSILKLFFNNIIKKNYLDFLFSDPQINIENNVIKLIVDDKHECYFFLRESDVEINYSIRNNFGIDRTGSLKDLVKTTYFVIFDKMLEKISLEYLLRDLKSPFWSLK